MLYSTAIDHVILNCYAGKPSDDSELSRSQVLSWLITSRDEIVKNFLDLQIRNNKPLDTFYQEREANLSAQAEDLTNTEEEDERIYVTLTKQPMNLLNDLGVVRVITEDGVMLNRSRNEQIDWVKDLKYAKPTYKTPVYYRDGRKVVLEGVNYKNLKTTYIVYYIPTSGSQTLTEASTIHISDEFLNSLIDQVTKQAKMELYGSMSDEENDGKDVKPEVK